MKKQKSKVTPKSKIKKTPDHHDAELALRLYDLRRETVMRQSRDSIFKFMPRSYEEFAEILKPEHPQNAAWRQVSSYFEMAFGFARHGIVNPDFLAENCGEGFILYAKVAPFLERFRKEAGSPNAFRNAEWMVTHSAAAKQRFDMFTARFVKPNTSK